MGDVEQDSIAQSELGTILWWWWMETWKRGCISMGKAYDKFSRPSF